MASTNTTSGTSTNNTRFMRKYIIRVGESTSSTGFKIDSSTYVEGSVPQIEFEVKKDNESNPNEIKIKLYNLQATTRAYLDRQVQNVELYAGYKKESEALLIGKGVIVDCTHNLTDVNTYTELTIFDGWKELKNTIISLSYEKGTSVKTIITAIASKMSLPLNISKDATDSTYKSGFSYSGTPAKALSKLCARAGLSWSIQDGCISITNKNSNTQRRAVRLSAQSGMIGSPEAIKLANRDIDDEGESSPSGDGTNKRMKNSVEIKSTTKERKGYKVKSLLLGQVNPGDLIEVTSTKTTCNGVYRVESITHKGSFYGTEWTSELIITEDEQFNYSVTPI